MTTKLAWRNIWRNKTRTFVFVAAAFLGFGVAILAINLMKSISQQRTNDAIDIQTSHIELHKKGFIEDKEISQFIPDADVLISEIRKVPNVNSVSKRISSNAVIASSENSVAGEIKGVFPEDEKKVSVLKDFIVDGTFLTGSSENQILVSKKIADKLKLKIRSKVVLTLKAANGEIVGAAFKVAGIFVTPSSPFDEMTFVVNYTDIAALMGISQPHEIAVRVTDANLLQTTEQAIKSKLPISIAINNWKELLPELTAFDGFLNMVGVLFSIVIIIGLGFSLLNTMNMIVQERTKEIGMLRAIGLSRLKVLSMLVKEAGMMMFVGSFSGIILGVVLVLITSKTGIRITSDGGALGIRSTVYPNLNPELLVMIIIIASVLTSVISLFPALRAFNIKPQTALKD